MTPQNCSPCTGSLSGPRGTSPPPSRSGSPTTSPAGAKTHDYISQSDFERRKGNMTRKQLLYKKREIVKHKLCRSHQVQPSDIPDSWCPLMSQCYLSNRTICRNYKDTSALTDGFVLSSKGCDNMTGLSELTMSRNNLSSIVTNNKSLK